MLVQISAIFLLTATVVIGQRPSFAGFRPIGYPDTPNRTTTVNPLGDRFGEGNTTTERLPLEANGDRDLVDRLSKLPLDKQPFWLLNWQALEEHRKHPQTYPQRPNSLAQAPVLIQNTNPTPPSFYPSSGLSTTSSSNSGFAPGSSGSGAVNSGSGPSNALFTPANSGFVRPNSGFTPPNSGNNFVPNSQTQNVNGGTLDTIVTTNSGNKVTTSSGLGNRFGEDLPLSTPAPTKTPDNSPDPFGNYPIAANFNQSTHTLTFFLGK